MANEDVKIVIRAVDKTKKAFRAVTIGLNAIKKAAFSMKSALIAVGIAGIGFLVKKSLNATDALGKMADKIGIGTAELGGLRHAAELTGIATNTLDMGLQRMVRRVSEAAAGTGEAKGALIELGLSAKALNDLSPDQQFKAIADAMAGVTEQGEKVRLAMKLFDSEGVALVNTLKGGSAAIMEMEKEAERLGLRLSRGLVQGVEDANDSMTRLGSYITTLFHRVVANLAPAIESVTDSLMGWFELKIDEAGGPAKLAISIADSVLSASATVLTAFRDMTESIFNFVNFSGQALQKFHRWLGDTEFTAGEMVFTGDSFDMAIFRIANMRTHLEALSAEAASAQGKVNSVDITSNGMALVDLTAMTNSQLIDLQDGYQLMAEGKKIAHNNRMNDILHAHLAKQSAMQKAAKASEVDNLQTSGKKVVGALSTQYKWAFDLHKKFAIKDALIDTYKAVSSSFTNAGGWPMGIGPAAVALAQGMANVQMLRATSYREKGGPVSAGSPYIVGERGPELIVPSQAANVVPNDQLGGNNVTINVTTNDANGFDDLLNRSRGTLLGLMNQALNENGRPALV
jgi:hypothetical protein